MRFLGALIVTGLVHASLAFAGPDPAEIVRRVQTTYKAGGDMQAAFVQTLTEKMRGKKRAERGRLFAAADGRVRWEYDDPVKKIFVYDGKAAYFYEPESAQVTEFEKFSDSPLANALRLLLGRGELDKSYNLGPCSRACEAAGPNDLSVALVPKEPIPGVEDVLFVVDAKSFKVMKTVVTDSLGNRTEYAFSDVTFGAKIDPKKLTFTVPEGVQRLRAPVDP